MDMTMTMDMDTTTDMTMGGTITGTIIGTTTEVEEEGVIGEVGCITALRWENLFDSETEVDA